MLWQTVRSPGTINDIGLCFSRPNDEPRPPVSARFSPSPPPPHPLTHSLFPAAPLPPHPLLLSSFERRQVGIRAAVNSPAPLSALMSLLLFALLNAIRAYSVSLPLFFPSPSLLRLILRAPLFPLPYDSSSPSLPSRNLRVDLHTHTYIYTRIYAHGHSRNTTSLTFSTLVQEKEIYLFLLTQAHRGCVYCVYVSRYLTFVYTRLFCVATIVQRTTIIAIKHGHASAHYCVISRTKTLS